MTDDEFDAEIKHLTACIVAALSEDRMAAHDNARALLDMGKGAWMQSLIWLCAGLPLIPGAPQPRDGAIVGWRAEWVGPNPEEHELPPEIRFAMSAIAYGLNRETDSLVEWIDAHVEDEVTLLKGGMLIFEAVAGMTAKAPEMN